MISHFQFELVSACSISYSVSIPNMSTVISWFHFLRQEEILQLDISSRLFGNLHLNQAYTWRFVIFQYP